MTILGKQLADGQLPAAEGDLYACPADTRAFVKSISCTNTSAANTNTVTLYLKPTGGTSRRLVRVPLSSNDQLYYLAPETLDTADAIRGEATNAAEVDYVISGAVEAT